MDSMVSEEIPLHQGDPEWLKAMSDAFYEDSDMASDPASLVELSRQLSNPAVPLEKMLASASLQVTRQVLASATTPACPSSGR